MEEESPGKDAASGHAASASSSILAEEEDQDNIVPSQLAASTRANFTADHLRKGEAVMPLVEVWVQALFRGEGSEVYVSADDRAKQRTGDQHPRAAAATLSEGEGEGGMGHGGGGGGSGGSEGFVVVERSGSSSASVGSALPSTAGLPAPSGVSPPSHASTSVSVNTSVSTDTAQAPQAPATSPVDSVDVNDIFSHPAGRAAFLRCLNQQRGRQQNIEVAFERMIAVMLHFLDACETSGDVDSCKMMMIMVRELQRGCWCCVCCSPPVWQQNCAVVVYCLTRLRW
jgi:hypothetical protein